MENRQSQEGGSRPTVGLLVTDIGDTGGYESAIWGGVAEGCQRQGANLICFVGGSLRFPSANGFESQRNAAYDLAAVDNVDGLVITGSLATYVSPEEFKAFCERYHPLPIVSVGLTQEAIPGVVVDNYGGMRSVIAHLTQVHGYRRVAFIRGPEGNEDAEQRYLAYTDVLTEYGLRPDSALVVPGNFSRSSGIEAVRLLLDELQVDFDAVVAANDNMALGALGELRRRGIRVPYDVVVAGFGDVTESRTAMPSLTTVRQPAHELGQRAVEALFTLLAGGAVPEQVIVPTRLVIRQSCGCLSQAAAQAAVGYINKVNEPLDTVLASQREDLLFKMARTVMGPSTGVIGGWVEQLLDSFQAELNDESEGAFLSALDTVLREVISEGDDVGAWQGAVSALRQYVLPYLLESEDLIRAEDLWQQARVLIGEMAERAQAQVRSGRERQAQAIREIGQALITAFDMRELMDIVVRELPRVGIPRCYLSLYKGL
jgi:DNA-binding LacI/PurR family transcriptional regulator